MRIMFDMDCKRHGKIDFFLSFVNFGDKNLFKIMGRKVSGSVKFLLKRTQNLNLHHPCGARVAQW